MASKLLRTIGNATPLHYVGRLRYFDQNIFGRELNVRALSHGSNRTWNRLEKRLHKQVANLELFDLLELVAEKDREAIENDFYYLYESKNRDYALEQLRLYLVEAHLENELVRVAYDPSAPLPKLVPLRRSQLFNAFNKITQAARQSLKRLNRLHRFRFIASHIASTQQTPNAPNTALAFSLAAA